LANTGDGPPVRGLPETPLPTIHAMTDPTSRIARATRPYLLQNAFILTDLPLRDLDLLRESANPERRKRGEMLFRQGGFPKGAFWLMSGKAKIFQELPGGRHQTLYVYSDGDLVGHRQVITEEEYPISAMLLENSVVGFIPGETFRALVDSSPFFSRNLLQALAREFTVWMNRLTVFAQLPVRRRLALALLMLHEQYRRPGAPQGLVTMTRTELSEYVGASLETVVRALNALKAAGLVHVDGRRIRLPDPPALADIFLADDAETV
jgi:CRP-like cAMP-binding protein